MDFTREPIIETIITPREGCKLVIRSSKSTGQEEFFVDAVEVVSFGQAQFFRSMEKPKPFLVPVSDYEALEVKEARMVLKHAGPDKAIKIGGGREAPRPAREPERVEERAPETEAEESAPKPEGEGEGRLERKRERRRPQRKRRGERDGSIGEEASQSGGEGSSTERREGEPARQERLAEGEGILPPPNLSALLAPPPMLISETIGRYRDNQTFKGAFFMSEEEEYKPHSKVDALLNEDDDAIPNLEKPDFASEEEVSQEFNAFEEGEKENSPHEPNQH